MPQSEYDWFIFFVERLPVLDLTWSEPVREAWFECFELLWRWGCRLDVLAAIEAYH